MARNLQSKLPNSDTLRVHDINPQILEKFLAESKAFSGGAVVQGADTARDAAEDSVRYSSASIAFSLPLLFYCSN